MDLNRILYKMMKSKFQVLTTQSLVFLLNFTLSLIIYVPIMCVHVVCVGEYQCAHASYECGGQKTAFGSRFEV